MSYIVEPGICYCSCHSEEGVMHCVPCCLGICPICSNNYTDEHHVEACQKRIADLTAELAPQA